MICVSTSVAQERDESRKQGLGHQKQRKEVYLKDYQTVAEAKLGLGRYFELYNTERLHQSLDYCTPAEVYGGRRIVTPDDADFVMAARGSLPLL